MQWKKPLKKAKAIFKNPAGTTHRHPAANTSINEEQKQYAAHWAKTLDTPAGQIEGKVSPARTKLFTCCLQRAPPWAWGLLTLILTTALSNCKWRGSIESTKKQVLHLQEVKDSLSQTKLRPQSMFAIYLLIRSWARKLSCIPISSSLPFSL